MFATYRLLFYVFFASFFFIEIANSSELKFTVDGDKLYYTSALAKNEIDQEINWDDIVVLEDLLKQHSGIKTLVLDSQGGFIAAAKYFADIIIDYELNTNVDGTCESACTIIFLAGEIRTIERGSWLGFHKTSWSSEHISEFYNNIFRY